MVNLKSLIAHLKEAPKGWKWEGWKREIPNFKNIIGIDYIKEYLFNEWKNFKETLFVVLKDIIIMFVVSAICLFLIDKFPSTRNIMLIIILITSVLAVSSFYYNLFGKDNPMSIMIMVFILILLFIWLANKTSNPLIIGIFSFLALFVAIGSIFYCILSILGKPSPKQWCIIIFFLIFFMVFFLLAKYYPDSTVMVWINSTIP